MRRRSNADDVAPDASGGLAKPHRNVLPRCREPQGRDSRTRVSAWVPVESFATNTTGTTCPTGTFHSEFKRRGGPSPFVITLAPMGSRSPITTTFILYLIALIGIGRAAWRDTRNLSDYVLEAGYSTPSAGASDMSDWLLMGLPGAIFASGLAEAWIGIGLAVGAWVNCNYLAARSRV